MATTECPAHVRSAAGQLDLSQPRLVLDRAALQRNIAGMAALAAAAGKQLRPHAKTHKCVQISRLQLEAGASGIACATLAEAEALAQAGIGPLLLTAPMAGARAAGWIRALHDRVGLSVVCDHVGQVRSLGAAMVGASRPLPVLIDVDVGQRRTGITSTEMAVALGTEIGDIPMLAFTGLQGFAGHVQHIKDHEERRRAAAAAAAILERIVAALSRIGLPCPIVSGSGTGAAAFDMAGPYSELQVGSYVFLDADYAAIEGPAEAMPWELALFVAAQVTSANRPGQVTINAGIKALAHNGPPPHLIAGAPAGTRYRFAGDEHGILELPGGAPAPEPGATVLLSATHCDPTVNLYGSYAVADAMGRMETWPIIGRYA